eukprot:jgi/Ulvmu1/5886/UM026_0007.1
MSVSPKHLPPTTNEMEERKSLCTVCGKCFSLYTCPRCCIRYCSVQCFQAHGDTCIDAFYRNNAACAMKGNYADASVQKSMSDILKRLHTLDVEDRAEALVNRHSNEAIDPAEESMSRLSSLAVQMITKMETANHFDFDALPAADQRELRGLFTSAAVGSIVTSWSPWWHTPEASRIRLNSQGQSLIAALKAGCEDKETSCAASQSAVQSSPPLPPQQPVPKLAVLATTPPHPMLFVNLLQTVFAYCSAMYLYNGDPCDDLPGYIDVLWQLAPHLCHMTTETALPVSVGAAVNRSIKQLQDIGATTFAGGLDGATGFGRWAWDGVASICASGRGAVICAMSDVHRRHEQVFEGGHHQAKRTKTHGSRRVAAMAVKTLKRCIRKIYFLLTFANDLKDEQYASWGKEIHAILDSQFGSGDAHDHLHSLLLVDDRSSMVNASYQE